ncbi:serine/threonine-protein kinase [Luteitalea sp.]|uniref:serine/threonine-protein kinase n=1 Tax=Luteitalea sp. TaxID=2004800 RepID=UPI0025B7EFE0|nr:serine/threonine-protein kinase [Luteitalea sp.]
MERESGAVSRLAAAVANGEAIDWTAARLLGRSDDERHVLAQLEAVVGLEQRPHADTSSSQASDGAVWLLDLALNVMAGVHVIFACAGQVVATPRTTFLNAQLAIMLALAGAALLLLNGGARDSRARHLGQLYLLLAAAMARPALEVLERGGMQTAALLWSGVYLESFIPLTTWRFAREFPFIVRFTRFDRLANLLMGLALSVSLVLFGSSAMARPGVGQGAAGLGWAATFSRRAPDGWFWPVVYLFLLAGVLAVVLRTRAAAEAERARARWFSLSLLAGFGPLVATGLSRATLPGLWQPLDASASATRLIDAAVFGGLLAVPFATSYAVLVHRVLSLRLVVRRALQYALARVSLVILTLLPIGWFVVQAYLRRGRTVEELAAEMSWPGLFTMGVGTLLLLTRGPMLRSLDRHFVGAPLDYGRPLSEAAVAISRARSRREIAASLAMHVQRTLGARSVSVLERRASGEWSSLLGGAHGPDAHGALTAVLDESSGAVSLEPEGPLYGLLPPRDQNWLTQREVHALVRIPGPDGSVIGCVAIGPRTNGFPLSRQDLDYADAAASTAGAALDALARQGSTELHSDDRDELAFECEDCGDVFEAAPRCVCASTDRMLASLPARVADKFHVTRRLGRGGMGVVYLAHDEALDRRVALKTLPRLSTVDPGSIRAEARAMAAVEHPCLATIFGLEVWRQTPILVAEYLPGGTVADRLRTRPFVAAEAIASVIALAEGLGALHALGFLHRDIKPSNIGFSASGRPKLLDFGLSRLIGRHTTSSTWQGSSIDLSGTSSALAGTPLYLSPEVLDGDSPSSQDDLWALTLVLVEMLGAPHPFSAPTVGRVFRKIRTTSGARHILVPEDAPKAITSFVERALHPRRSERFRSATDFADALRAILHQGRVGPLSA